MVSPDGSKIGFGHQRLADELRSQIKTVLRHYGTYLDWVEVFFGTPDILGPLPAYSMITDARGHYGLDENDNEAAHPFDKVGASRGRF